jgi:endonuclease YncB( thermonuclease family)
MYGRTITDVFLPDGMSLNQELIKQGWCWWYRKYAPGDVVLGGLATEAREAKKGLWVIPVQVAAAAEAEQVSGAWRSGTFPDPRLIQNYPVASGAMDTPPTLQ